MYKFFIVVIALTWSVNINAMQCVPKELPTQWESADYIFLGTVTEREKLKEQSDGICWTDGEMCGSKIATLTVDEVWKGHFASETTKVFSVDGCYCLGTYFKRGSRYIVFGTVSDDQSFSMVDLGACYTALYEEAKQSGTDQELTRMKESAGSSE